MLKKFLSKRNILILILIIIFLIFNLSDLSKNFRSQVQFYFNTSANYVLNWSRLSNLKHLSDCEELLEKYSDLQNIYSERLVDLAYVKKLEAENETLRQHFDFSKEKDYEYLLTNVIGRENILGLRGYEQHLIIDRGSKHNIKTNLAVVNEKGIVIGLVKEVSENISSVCLLTSQNCRLAVSILNSDRSIGLTEGELGLTVSIDMIPQSEKINIGDIVVSSGLDTNIPNGLVIGEISRVNKKSNEIWQEAVIETDFSLNNLNILSVIIP